MFTFKHIDINTNYVIYEENYQENISLPTDYLSSGDFKITTPLDEDLVEWLELFADRIHQAHHYVIANIDTSDIFEDDIEEDDYRPVDTLMSLYTLINCLSHLTGVDYVPSMLLAKGSFFAQWIRESNNSLPGDFFPILMSLGQSEELRPEDFKYPFPEFGQIGAHQLSKFYEYMIIPLKISMEVIFLSITNHVQLKTTRRLSVVKHVLEAPIGMAMQTYNNLNQTRPIQAALEDIENFVSIVYAAVPDVVRCDMTCETEHVQLQIMDLIFKTDAPVLIESSILVPVPRTWRRYCYHDEVGNYNLFYTKMVAGSSLPTVAYRTAPGTAIVTDTVTMYLQNPVFPLETHLPLECLFPLELFRELAGSLVIKMDLVYASLNRHCTDMFFPGGYKRLKMMCVMDKIAIMKGRWIFKLRGCDSFIPSMFYPVIDMIYAIIYRQKYFDAYGDRFEEQLMLLWPSFVEWCDWFFEKPNYKRIAYKPYVQIGSSVDLPFAVFLVLFVYEYRYYCVSSRFPHVDEGYYDLDMELHFTPIAAVGYACRVAGDINMTLSHRRAMLLATHDGLSSGYITRKCELTTNFKEGFGTEYLGPMVVLHQRQFYSTGGTGLLWEDPGA